MDTGLDLIGDVLYCFLSYAVRRMMSATVVMQTPAEEAGTVCVLTGPMHNSSQAPKIRLGRTTRLWSDKA